jgi:hypothetical protein
VSSPSPVSFSTILVRLTVCYPVHPPSSSCRSNLTRYPSSSCVSRCVCVWVCVGEIERERWTLRMNGKKSGPILLLKTDVKERCNKCPVTTHVLDSVDWPV